MAIILFYDIYDIDGLMLLYSLEAKLKRIMLNDYLPRQALKRTLVKSRDCQMATCLNLRKSRLSDGWKLDTRANQGTWQRNVQRLYWFVYYKKDLLSKCTASILRAFENSIASRNSYIHSLVLFVLFSCECIVENHYLRMKFLGGIFTVEMSTQPSKLRCYWD